MLQKRILIINECYGITITETLTVGRGFKYTGKSLYFNGIHVQDTIIYSNGSNRLRMNPYSNRKGILSIYSGNDGDWDNSPNKIYHGNIPNNINHVYDFVHVNGCVSYESQMTGNPKP